MSKHKEPPYSIDIELNWIFDGKLELPEKEFISFFKLFWVVLRVSLFVLDIFFLAVGCQVRHKRANKKLEFRPWRQNSTRKFLRQKKLYLIMSRENYSPVICYTKMSIGIHDNTVILCQFREDIQKSYFF